jgi:hypothetical protein
MPIRTFIIAAATIFAIALPLAVLANQPRVPEKPSLDAARVLSLLVLDPYEATDMQVELPQGYATLDVDADPFKG